MQGTVVLGRGWFPRVRAVRLGLAQKGRGLMTIKLKEC
jgi:hypothetical protein